MRRILYNHIAPGLSQLEARMAKHIPAGGNWKNIPADIPSERLAQIRRSGGRTTYYGRLREDRPSYTITTYFNRLGNGCNLHPTQDRIISIREGARLQSFKDSFNFCSSKTSQYKQIGNAVPPLLARSLASELGKYLENFDFVDLFCGAGGMSEGFSQAGFSLKCANEIDRGFLDTFKENHCRDKTKDNVIMGDITDPEIKHRVLLAAGAGRSPGLVIGGPPCQGFSYAGWRDADDKRNQLFLDFLEIVEQTSPEIFVMENVPGILTMRNGKAIHEIGQLMAGIGYFLYEPMLLRSEEYGVPQLRRRVFLVGSKKKLPIMAPRPLFSYDKSDLPDPISVGEAIGGLPELPINSGSPTIVCDYDGISPYERLMLGDISFETFYSVTQNSRS
jgi:DNA (cytosine-5)-methyltransferase 1